LSIYSPVKSKPLSIHAFALRQLQELPYETSFGWNPMDGSIYLPETNSSALVLKFIIAEPNNCGDPNQSRKTMVQIVRRSKLSNGSSQDTVVSDFESSTNPMCPNVDSKLEIAWQNIKFTCQYFGSEGTTSSAFSVRNLIRAR
jgi:hypothetical protein